MSETLTAAERVKAAERKADLALFIACVAYTQATYRPRRKSLCDRLWDLV